MWHNSHVQLNMAVVSVVECSSSYSILLEACLAVKFVNPHVLGFGARPFDIAYMGPAGVTETVVSPDHVLMEALGANMPTLYEEA